MNTRKSCDLELRTIGHPALSGRAVGFFGPERALRHLLDHVLTHPECLGWRLIFSGADEIVDLQEGKARRRYAQEADRTGGRSAQALYDLYARASDDASREARRLKWHVTTDRAFLALGLSGVLLVVGRDRVLAAFLPGHGDRKRVARERAREDPGLLGRESAEDPPRQRRRRFVSFREARRELKQRESWDPEEKLFYEVFRPAVQFIRQAPKDGYAINGRPIAKGGGNSRGGYGEGPPGRGGGNSRGGPAGRGNVGEYGQLAGVLPPMSRLKLEHWRAYREEAATRRSER